MTWLPAHAISRLQEAAAEPGLEGTRFVPRQLLGRGGMGAVWLADDPQLGREVAVKVLAEPLAGEAEQARLLTEARILARLEHPGIVPVHDAGTLPDGRAWYAMKRVRGKRLDEHVEATTPLTERLRIFERLCETMAFAHAHGVVHRDLKPGNVMVGEFGEVLVLDWGIAKLLDAADLPASAGGGPGPPAPEATAPGTRLGTPGFMPPEQAEGRAAGADARADVWGLGALLHVLLTGRPPDSPLGRARWGEGVPRPLEAICRKALATTPDDRYASADALRADVSRYLEGRAVHARREAAWETAARVVRKYGLPIGLVLAYLVMRAVLAAWLKR